LAVVGGCWRLLAVVGGCWRLLAVVGGCWRLLAVAGGCSSETNSTCKLTVLRVEPHVIASHKRMRIIPCYFLTELHGVIVLLL
jgi:hypothetical protein